MAFDITCVAVDGDIAAGLTESFWWVDVADCCPELVLLFHWNRIESFTTLYDISTVLDQTTRLDSTVGMNTSEHI